mmetsp:Transcript_49221/g.88481  ORF Transcript_49221/g.88481 Transcript_49221/m.88481 type:complete len:258 (+) Transcript_49221:138-911(+)
MVCLVDLLDGGAAAATRSTTHASTGHTTLRHSSATCGLVDLHHDGVHDALQLLLLGLELVLLGQLVLVQPVQCLLHCRLNLLLVSALKLVLELLLVQGVAHGEAVVLQTVLGLDLLLVRFIFSTELLGLLHHAVDFGLRQTALLVGDGNLVGLAGGLVRGADVQNAVGINVIRDLNLGHAARSGRDAIQVELAKQVVVLGHGTLTFEDLDQHSWLIVCIGREGLRLLRGDGRVPLDQLGHHTTGGLQAHGQRGHVQQ